MHTTDFTVTGMTCGNCENHVREEVSAVAGVTGLEVSAATGTLRVESEGPIDAAAVIAAVDEAGYAATAA
ncbi:copper chaperone CopZ [Leucobacter komagatae]|uniref:Copper chaperone CopZ n=1 Tax=Leucobacter komagatae TaxID=55969 RepID=A0A542Y800_9MICO|nr:cation transporter [Leucobacter komagatae]TQL44147.1 copper chaperone CopZ [Leucobacter komagatae]